MSVINSKGDLKLAFGVFSLLKQGRISFCDAIQRVFGRYGEKTYIYEKYRDRVLSEMFKALESSRKGELDDCFHILFPIVLDLDEKMLPRLILLLLDRVDPRNIKSVVKKMLKEYLISWDELRQLSSQIYDLDDSTVAKLLFVLDDLLPSELKREILNRLKSTDNPYARQWYAVSLANTLSADEIESVLDEIEKRLPVSLSLENNLDSLLEYLLLSFSLFNKIDKVAKVRLKEILRDHIDKIFERISKIDFRILDKPMGDAIIWLSSNFAQLLRYENVERILVNLTKYKVIDNIEAVSEILAKTRDFSIKKMLRLALKLANSSDWTLRLLSLNIFIELTKHDKSYLRHVAKFCRDKRSQLREKCSNFLVSYLKKEKRTLKSILESIVSSQNTKSIATMLEALLEIEIDSDTLTSIVKKSLYYPRSTIYSKALELIERKWKNIDLDELYYIIEKIYKFSINKKKMRRNVETFLKNLVREIDNEYIKKKISEILSKTKDFENS